MIFNKTEYEKIIKDGKRVGWYDTEVPEDFLTPLVKTWCDNVVSEIDKLESELSDLRGKSVDDRKKYIEKLWINVRNAPYSLNGDVYLHKKTRIEKEMSQKTKPKTRKTRRKTTEKTTKKNNSKGTKNSSLIFGNKNKK